MDETVRAVATALLQYGVLGIVTIMLAAFAVIQQKRIDAQQVTIEEVYREQVETVQKTLERTITQMERSTSALSELAKVEEGRIVEIRQFYETLRKMLQELDKALGTLFSEQHDQLKAVSRSNVNDVLAAIQALRADVIATLEVLRRHR